MEPDRGRLPRWDAARWGPLAPAVVSVIATLWLVATTSSHSVHHVSLLISAVIWALVATGVALGSAGRLLSSRLRRWPRAALVMLAVSTASAAATLYFHPAYSWLPLLMALLHGSLSAGRPFACFVIWIFVPSLTLLLVDSTLILFRNSVTLLRIPAVRRVASPLYVSDWNVIQFMPECARYDEELTYTLRPGNCVFEETEFQTTYHINSLGLRDDEDSLDAPVVVVSGDSVTMGWGVEQHQAFPARVEALTGLKTLNAGIASYGTAREMALLNRVNRSALRYLVVQYSGNDYGENRAFGAMKRTPIQSRSWYRRQQEYVVSQRRYRPGRYLYETYRREIELRLMRRPQAEPERSNGPDDFRDAAGGAVRGEVKLFLDALGAAPPDLEAVQLILYIDGAKNRSETDFVEDLNRQLPSSGLPERFAGIHTLSSMSGSVEEDRFLLDPHLNAAGNEKIAHALADLILKLDRSGGWGNGR